ncbi:hypothetical protein [Niveispirillum sp. KHB5.9]|uniref:hypothetical protein n=1 Tax=Niveispirillum sp. KHB5.9 TaxID=3400269 RepID=UPI003A8BCFF9
MPAARTDIDLARVLTMLAGPLSTRQRDECRRVIARYVLAPERPGMNAEQAEAALLSAAATLAGHGWSEIDIRDALNDDRACLERAGRRRAGAR